MKYSFHNEGPIVCSRSVKPNSNGTKCPLMDDYIKSLDSEIVNGFSCPFEYNITESDDLYVELNITYTLLPRSDKFFKGSGKTMTKRAL